MAYYSKTIQEEELKNRVRQNWFSGYDNANIPGKVDFYVGNGDTSYLWAEAKRGVKKDIYEQFVQLILTIGKDRRFNEYDAPDYLGAFDAEKIGFVHYDEISDVFELNDFNWQVTPSDHNTKEFKYLYKLVHDTLKNNVFVFNFEQQGDSLRFFIKDKFSLTGRRASQINVNKNNFPHVYRRWLKEVKDTLDVNWNDLADIGVYDCHFFLADLMSQDNTTLLENLTVLLLQDHYKVNTGKLQGNTQLFAHFEFKDKQMAHHLFWQRYKRPPKSEYRDYIIERADRLRPQDIRERHGSYFTPMIWVEKSQEYIAQVLGENWQDEYYVWDCAAGTGNLLAGLVNRHNIWASTLEQADVDTIKERINNGANLFKNHVFQFDFLNDALVDEVSEYGKIKKSKVPQDLQAIISDPEKRKRLVIYINPPFAEGDNSRGEGRSGVAANTEVAKSLSVLMGYAKRELYIQFLTKIYHRMNGVVIANFSTLKNLQAPKFADFRRTFALTPKAMFIVPADTFDNVTGSFPIGFTIWKTDEKEPFMGVVSDVYNEKGEKLFQKHIVSYENLPLINSWAQTFIDDTQHSIATIIGVANDFQNQKTVRIERPHRPWNHQYQWQITPYNIIESCIYMAVRLVVEATWENDRDQFLFPKDTWMVDEEFKLDCLTYAIFSNKNNIRSSDGLNYWLPFTEEELGIANELPCHFMTDLFAGTRKQRLTLGSVFDSDYGKVKTPLLFSAEAKVVFNAGKKLWKYYFQQPEADLNASYYDIRQYFQGTKIDKKGKVVMNSASDDDIYMELHTELRKAHNKLADKIRPKVYEHGFLI
ncbi:MAG: hypothetical protein J6B33_02880 [Prevotella sp.]|nr:hypothetical protein [Prevotella sp.]